MSSPVFDNGTGRRFAQKVLDNILYGINIKDERNFTKNAHIISSIINVLFSLIQIGTSLIPARLGIISFVIPVATGFVISTIYLILSFVPKQR